MSEHGKNFTIEIEESISSAFMRAYGKVYSGKYSFNKELGKWESESAPNTYIEFFLDKKCFRLYDEDLDLQIDASGEASKEDDPSKLSWGKLTVTEGDDKKEESLPEFEFQAMGDAPPPSPTSTPSLSASPTSTSSATPSLSASPTSTASRTCDSFPYAESGPSEEYLGAYYPSGYTMNNGSIKWTNGTRWITHVSGRWGFRSSSGNVPPQSGWTNGYH